MRETSIRFESTFDKTQSDAKIGSRKNNEQKVEQHIEENH